MENPMVFRTSKIENVIRALLIVTSCAAGACSSSSPPPTGIDDTWQTLRNGSITVEYQGEDASVASTLLSQASSGSTSVERFFQRQLSGPITVRAYPDRASLTEYWKVEWNQPNLVPECWMIASANSNVVAMLTPRLWSSASCGHDGANQPYVSRIVTHEIVHILHRRINGAPAFVGPNDLWWFVEGLAVFASGQLDNAARTRVRNLITSGSLPASPQEALNGPSGYDVVGSMVGFIDATYGRAVLTGLLTARTEAELLARLSTTRSAFLESWRLSL
ncbi:MAG TPA: hypothetical protein VM939_02590 [Gemmatimonadaceae bacterium]|nr:hypothetical protein [Gemmatimonadaceae bacterium]